MSLNIKLYLNKYGNFNLDNNAGEVSIIAEEFQGVKDPASTFMNINIYNINLKNYGKNILRERGNFDTGMLVLKGEIKINEE